jgi:hypothetical protein
MKVVGVQRQDLDQLVRLIRTEQQGRHVVVSRLALRDFQDQTPFVA